jgi:hypothetical protein
MIPSGMRGPARLVGITALVAAIGAAAALAQEVDRVSVGGSNTTRAFSPALFVTVTTLPDFRRTGFDGNSGGWEGPVCDFAPNPRLSGPISLSWSVGFDGDVRSAEGAARAQLTFEWTTIESGPIAIPHLVGGREVGTIPGFFVLTDSGGQTGYHESALGLPLGRGVYAAVEFWSRGNALECTVRGVPVASWHRDTARAAVRQVRLEGNLPPSRVTARARGRALTGAVADSFGHPSAGAAVRLEQRVGTRWRSVRSGRTSSTGAYSLRARRPGSHRVVASLAGVSARSAAVRVR